MGKNGRPYGRKRAQIEITLRRRVLSLRVQGTWSVTSSAIHPLWKWPLLCPTVLTSFPPKWPGTVLAGSLFSTTEALAGKGEAVSDHPAFPKPTEFGTVRQSPRGCAQVSHPLCIL